MARRADHTHEELMELSIQAGLELIKKEGFSGFSARKVAATIGYTVGTLYNVFGSYDVLILHINARTLDEWYDVMYGAVQKAPPHKQIHALAKAYIQYSRNHYQQWKTLFEYQTDENRVLPGWYMEKMAHLFDLAEQAILPLVKQHPQKAKQTAHVLWAGIHGICILSLSGKLDLVHADSAEMLTTALIENYVASIK